MLVGVEGLALQQRVDELLLSPVFLVDHCVDTKSTRVSWALLASTEAANEGAGRLPRKSPRNKATKGDEMKVCWKFWKTWAST